MRLLEANILPSFILPARKLIPPTGDSGGLKPTKDHAPSNVLRAG